MCSFGKTLLAFAPFHFVLQGQIRLLLQESLYFYFCITVPYNEKGIFLQVGSRCLVGLHIFRGYNWITVIVNVLPWKQEEIILLLLRLQQSTAFWTLLLTMRTNQFLLRDS